MTAALTTSERRAYRQVCGANGLMIVVAADQRGGMRKVLADTDAEREAIDEARLGIVKAAIVRHLANKASAVLLDPVCAVPAVVDEDVLARDVGLLIGLDASGYDTDAGGYRLSRLVPDVTARRVRELGGTGAKLLVYLRPDRADANEHNMRIVRDCVADFAAEDVLLVVEILTYRLEDESEADYRAAHPGLIVECARMALEAGSKVLKLPYPGTAGACRAITELCGGAPSAGGVPWAVLSAGVDHATFVEQVRTAMEGGASGVIAGRALWKDCISLDADECARRLEGIASERLREIERVIDAYAAPPG